MNIPRTFTAMVATEVTDHCFPESNHALQLQGEDIIMVVGGDNLADNEQSSFEIYNR